MKKYPDISRLLKDKAERRRGLARLSFEEKIAIVNRWRKLSLEIKNLPITNASIRSKEHE